ncbi:MAG: alpha/beta fold hydrolase [Bacteroidetes bacterium]|jgi:acyl transferase domain-containing protein/surfactin synthase thioesterase subunit|nr:alpha/beta fold hydrolase [Bacteroidota bacterium]
MKNTINSRESIAVVGLSCRYPKVNNIDEFWQILSNGENIIDDVPANRWNMAAYFHEDKSLPGKTNQSKGGFLNDIHDFDPTLFNISPKEAIEMSPSQKLMMELAWEATENSSIPYNRVAGSRAGVYIGNIWSDFEHLRKVRNAEVNNFSGIGFSANVIANRISYFMGLTGPSLVLDTGCSSSLVALLLALESLQLGTSDLCFAGGINHMLDPDIYVYLSKFGGLSDKGRSSSFDAEADGFVRAEGAGLVMLKRLSDAVRDGDNIRAVFRGGAMNNNGFNNNMPATSVKGQKEVLMQAYENAGVNPADVHYVEAHGTGTKLGDPVEANAIGEFFSTHKAGNEKLYLGSAKANFGHTEAAAGITGILKVILSMQYGCIPKNPFFETPNPKIEFDRLRLAVARENTPWPVSDNETMKAGISSFGWGGTNVHLVIEEYKNSIAGQAVSNDFDQTQYVLPISAKSEGALKAYLKSYAQLLEHEINGSETMLRNTCAATAILKPGLDYRKAVYGGNKQELVRNIKAFLEPDDAEIDPVHENTTTRTVFVFPGQGSQWVGMGKSLYATEKVYRETIDACDKAFKNFVGWSLIDEIHASKENSRLKRIDVIQPALFASQVALAKLWISRGVKPDAVVGHSMGEVAAAYISGVLSLDDAACVICSRSLLMKTLSGTGGAMAVTELTYQEAEKEIEPYHGRLSVAVHNSPKSTVIAGDENAVNEVLQKLENKNLFCRPVKVDVASHSPQMDTIKEELGNRVQHIRPQKASVPVYSTSANAYMEGEKLDADFWMNNLRNTVQFYSVVEKLIESDHRLFIEMSPHPVLKTALCECIQACKAENTIVLNSLHRDEPEQEELMKNFAALYESGYDIIDWKKYYGIEKIPYVKLPSYPYQRENFEIRDRSNLLGGRNKANVHPLLGDRIQLAGNTNVHYWQNTLSLHHTPFLAGHKVNDNVIFPAACYIEMVMAAAGEMYPDHKFEIQNLAFIQSIIISDDQPAKIQLRLEKHKGQNFHFQFYKLTGEQWEECCRGELSPLSIVPVHIENVENKTTNVDGKAMVPAQFYKAFADFGVEFDEVFQNILDINIEGNSIQATLQLNEKAMLTESYTTNPVFLDNCVHPLFAATFSEAYKNTMKTTFVGGMDRVIKYREVNPRHKYSLITRDTEYSTDPEKKMTQIKGDVLVLDDQKNPVLAYLGVEAKIIDSDIVREKTTTNNSEDILSIIRSEKNSNQSLSLVENYLIRLIAKATKANAAKINTKMTFKKLGVDSLTMVQIRNIIEKDFDTKLTVSTFTQYPGINDYASFLLNSVEDEHISVTDENHNPWFVEYPSPSEATHQLFLFHDAGGSSNLFEGWRELINENTDLICIELPGRGNRVDEEPYTNFWPLMRKLVPQIKAKIDKPFSLYGHSMGGLMAFETSRYLRARYNITPEKLMVSGTPCLRDFENHFVNRIFNQNMSDAELITYIPALQQLNLDNPAGKAMLQTLRADFRVIYTHNYFDDEPLKFPVVAIHAENDDRVNREDVERWQIETDQDFNLIQAEGGHDFVYHDKVYVTGVINTELITDCIPEENKLIKTEA